MPDLQTPADDQALVAAIDDCIAILNSKRQIQVERLPTLDAEQVALPPHPNYKAYVAGGMLKEKGFEAGHILGVIGFHALPWRIALAKLADAIDLDDQPACLLHSLRLACEADPMLEVAGHALLAELDLLERGGINPFWLRRPKLGLGQAAKVFGLEPHHADGHRGLYALAMPMLRRGFENAGVNQSDRRFGALLLPVVETGGERLAIIGAKAFHRDAEARYRADCESFADHQRRHPGRRWRWKPALSRQGHLAVTTARAKDIVTPAERSRGHAANWLDNHNANLRFNREDQTS